MMIKGQMKVLESLLSLLLVLLFTILVTYNYMMSIRSLDLESKELKYSILSALIKLDSCGFLSNIIENEHWNELYDILRELIPNRNFQLIILNENFQIIAKLGTCNDIAFTISYVIVSNNISFYEVRIIVESKK